VLLLYGVLFKRAVAVTRDTLSCVLTWNFAVDVDNISFGKECVVVIYRWEKNFVDVSAGNCHRLLGTRVILLFSIVVFNSF